MTLPHFNADLHTARAAIAEEVAKGMVEHQQRQATLLVDPTVHTVSATTEPSLSMIPSTNPPEVLRQLLQSAHDQGFGAGAGDVAMDMIESLFKNDRSGRAGSKP